MVAFTILAYCQGKQVDDENRDCPAAHKVQKQEWQAEDGVGFVENMQEREVHHDYAHDEKNHP